MYNGIYFVVRQLVVVYIFRPKIIITILIIIVIIILNRSVTAYFCTVRVWNNIFNTNDDQLIYIYIMCTDLAAPFVLE